MKSVSATTLNAALKTMESALTIHDPVVVPKLVSATRTNAGHR